MIQNIAHDPAVRHRDSSMREFSIFRLVRDHHYGLPFLVQLNECLDHLLASL